MDQNAAVPMRTMTMLNNDQLEAFEKNGFLVVEDIMNASLLESIEYEYEALLTSVCRDWADQGLIDPAVIAMPFDRQLTESIKAGLDYFQPLDISLPLGDVTPDTPIHLGDSVFRMMTDSHLLDTVESFIGPEITSNPIQHVRIKPPLRQVAEGECRAHIVKTDWHQDRAVALAEADLTRMVTVWLAITDATVENGCLQVIPGSHQHSILPHCPLDQLAIPTDLFAHDKAKTLPIKAGGAIFFHPLTVHSSLENYSESIRWSFDIRYSVTGDPTGRPHFPEFIARSRAHPNRELRCGKKWSESWLRKRAELSVPGSDLMFHRWDGSDPVCA